MATNNLKTFSDTAKGLSKSPLGIIALFIVLVYGFAALVVGIGQKSLEGTAAHPLIWFLVLFPVIVLGVFAWLVAWHHEKLYGPGDFKNQEDFLKLQDQLKKTKKEYNILAEASNVAVNFSEEKPKRLAAAEPNVLKTVKKAILTAEFHPDDPQKGQWGGREANHRKITVGKIHPLKADPDYYRIPLEVRSTDPAGYPLTGKVRFHLHNSFSPDVEEVEVENGVARLTLVAYGAFTVGAELSDGTKLELDLADDDIDAPKQFKEL
jgi:hypothetical protein